MPEPVRKDLAVFGTPAKIKRIARRIRTGFPVKILTYKIPKEKFAAPDISIVEHPIPETRSGEVLVRIHFSCLSVFELVTSKGERNAAIARALKKSPLVSGIEMAGIVESDGKTYKKGDRVFGYTHIFKGPFFHSEYAAVPEAFLATVPPSMSLAAAASVVGGALTSLVALERFGRVKKGDKILITGATGSVGITAVQLANYLGAEISGISHSSQTQFLRESGAKIAYAYDKNEMPVPAKQFDLVFDAAPSLSFSTASKYLASRGKYITTMPHEDVMGFFHALFSRRKWGYLMVYTTDKARMERVRLLIEQGAFSQLIDSTFRLENAVEAFAHQHQKGKKGKILLDSSPTQ